MLSGLRKSSCNLLVQQEKRIVSSSRRVNGQWSAWFSSSSTTDETDNEGKLSQENEKTNKINGDSISEDEMNQFLAKGETDTSVREKLTTDPDSKKVFQELMGGRTVFPGTTYDPTSLLDNENASNRNQRFRRRFQNNLPRPGRLVVTGFEIHHTNIWFLSRFLNRPTKIRIEP